MYNVDSPGWIMIFASLLGETDTNTNIPVSNDEAPDGGNVRTPNIDNTPKPGTSAEGSIKKQLSYNDHVDDSSDISDGNDGQDLPVPVHGKMAKFAKIGTGKNVSGRKKG